MGKIKILAVDADYTTLALIHSTFPEYDITIETSAWEAEKLIKTRPYDLFIIDYLMPNINGIELRMSRNPKQGCLITSLHYIGGYD